jgi:diguanylate cyclase (GGDEF)-like protein
VKRLENRFRLRFCIFISILLLYVPVAFSEILSLTSGGVDNLSVNGQLYQAGTEGFPESADEFPDWYSHLEAIPSVNLFGGAYWLYAEVRNDSDITQWIVNPDGTLIEHVEIRLYPQEGKVQRFVSGYTAEHDYMLHYGKAVQLLPGSSAKLLIRFDSPYFASHPKFELVQEPEFRQRVSWDNVLALAAFGALLTLALYNLFIFTITHDRTFLYYALYLVAFFLGWVFTFHIPSELFGWHNLHLHYIPFFLVPVLNTLFYMEFLQLKTQFPRLAAISRINIILPLVTLPVCFFALSYAHVIATLVITIWFVIALVSGIVSWRSGFKPARYFVLAFIALLVPNAILLPANVGLIPDLVRNTELLTLLGGTLDAILLAFALADKIRVLADEKDQALQHANQMLAMARTDHLTGITNRQAFDQAFEDAFELPENADDPRQLMLFLIDLDGLKRINDNFGHSRGDELLCSFAKDLSELQTKDISVYRIGGDEFTILACRCNDLELRAAMANLETLLGDRGFAGVGISYGVAFACECESPEDMLARADMRMYTFKASRMENRSQKGKA